MAMEDLLRIAERTEDLPDQALAEIAASNSGIESVIAASEIKARADIREGAQQAPRQAQPPVVDQLINMAMRQPMPPMGAPMPPQMQQPMGQPMPPQMGMQQPMPQPVPPQMAPDMAQLAQQMGVPAMNTGGLIRRFQAGTQGTIGGGNFFDFYQQQLGYDPRTMLAGNVQAPAGFSLTPEQIDELQKQYEAAMSGTGIYSDQVEAAAQTFSAAPRMRGPAQTGPRTQQEAMDRALEEARLDAARNVLTSSGLPQGNIQSLMPVGSQTPVQAFVPGGQQRTVLPSGYSLFSPTAAAPPAGPAAAPPAGPASRAAPPPAGQTAAFGGVGSSANIPVTAAEANILTADAAYIDPKQLGATGGTGSTGLYANLVGNNPYSSIESKISGNLNNQMLRDLIDREDKYNKAIDAATEKMKTLEGDLPTRENIKDRIKEQTKLGMAKAFFDAAGSGSPDFLTALAQGMGGAAGVMNKMTGEEQKDLHQHALQMFQLEREKANTAFKRQDQTLSKIQNARAYQQTVSQNNRDLSLRLAEMQQKYGQDARNFAFEVAKFNAEQAADFKDDQAANAKTFEDLSQNYRSVDFDMKADAEEHDLSLAVNGFANLKVERAQNIANKGVKAVVKDMADVAKQLTPEQQQLPLAEQERIIASQLIEQYREGNNLGKLDVLRVFGDELRGLYGSAGTPQYDQSLQAFATKYPYIDTNYITDNATPIY
jgi:hypothetical protein